ncbi:MAG: hypothetical protein WC209_02260 [Ignavibacteriaceae bacterium]|jgi:hypothetical protein
MEALLTILGIFVGAFITLCVQWYDHKTKFRLVAIEKRLQTHQEAFAMWYKLIEVIHSNIEAKNNVIIEARNFWINNCLYLEKNTRREFNEVINLVSDYSQKLQMTKDEPNPDEKAKLREDYLNDWKRIFDLTGIIQSEVELKPIVLKIEIPPEGK